MRLIIRTRASIQEPFLTKTKADFQDTVEHQVRFLKILKITFSLAAEIRRQTRGRGQRALGSYFWILSGEKSPEIQLKKRRDRRLIEGRGRLITLSRYRQDKKMMF